jgi:hypothetical protein
MTDPATEKLAAAIESEITAELQQSVAMRAIKRAISCLGLTCFAMGVALSSFDLVIPDELQQVPGMLLASGVALFITRLLMAIPLNSSGVVPDVSQPDRASDKGLI